MASSQSRYRLRSQPAEAEVISEPQDEVVMHVESEPQAEAEPQDEVAPVPPTIYHEDFKGLPAHRWNEVTYDELLELEPGTLINYVRDSYLSPGERKKLYLKCAKDGLDYQAALKATVRNRKKIRCAVADKPNESDNSDSESDESVSGGGRKSPLLRVNSIARKFKDPSKRELSDVRSHKWVLRPQLAGNPKYYIKAPKVKKPRAKRAKKAPCVAHCPGCTCHALPPYSPRDEVDPPAAQLHIQSDLPQMI